MPEMRYHFEEYNDFLLFFIVSIWLADYGWAKYRFKNKRQHDRVCINRLSKNQFSWEFKPEAEAETVTEKFTKGCNR